MTGRLTSLPDPQQALTLSSSSSSCTVYIGRFQPLHNSHAEIIRRALAEADFLIMVIGSAFMARNVRNPFTAEERQELIDHWLQACNPAWRKRVRFVFLRDFYDLAQWSRALIDKVGLVAPAGAKISLIGHLKDESSLYLNCFPLWPLIEIEDINHLSATEVRDLWFKEDLSYKNLVPAPVFHFLQKFSQTDDFKRLKKEYSLLKSSKKMLFPERVICLYAASQVLLRHDPETGDLFLPSPEDLPLIEFLQKRDIVRGIRLPGADLPFKETLFWELDGNFDFLPPDFWAKGFKVVKKDRLSGLEERFREAHFMVTEKFLQVLPAKTSSDFVCKEDK